MAMTLSPKKNAVERFGELLLETEQHTVSRRQDRAPQMAGRGAYR